jgi:ribosomal protein S18 acetylase RimI-like enzyme
VRASRLLERHAQPYRALMLDAYVLHPDAFTSSVNERASLPLSWWEARLSDQELASEVVFGCFVEEQLAGVVGLSFDDREKARHKAHLFGMYVPLRYRRKGLGDALLRAAVAHAVSRPGVKLVQLTVTQGNREASALYERHGFETFGLEPCAVALGDGFVSKLHMWRDLSHSPRA